MNNFKNQEHAQKSIRGAAGCFTVFVIGGAVAFGAIVALFLF